MEDMSVQYEARLRERITQLRVHKNVSEYRMSWDLGKSGAYIRNITSGASMPSVRELFNIIGYFGMTPAEFFRGMEANPSPRALLCDSLLELSDEDRKRLSCSSVGSGNKKSAGNASAFT